MFVLAWCVKKKQQLNAHISPTGRASIYLCWEWRVKCFKSAIEENLRVDVTVFSTEPSVTVHNEHVIYRSARFPLFFFLPLPSILPLLTPSSSSSPRRSPSHPSVPYHYYEPSGPDECSMYLSHERRRRGGHHRFNTERAVFANWARTLDVHFYQPDWTPTSGNASSGFSPSLFQLV